MKYLTSLIVIALLFVACAENEKKDKAALTETPLENEKIEAEPSGKIPFLDYAAFEREYFQQENDTTYVVNFWATWCKPCVKELPAFEKIRTDYADQKVKVVLVSLDFPEKVDALVIPFIEKRDLQSEVVLLDDPDANSWIPKVSEEWSGAIPATVIIKEGEKSFYERSFTFEELETELLTIL